MNILVLEHGRQSYVCLFGRWAAARGHSLTLCHAPTLSSWPPHGTFDRIVCLGSDASVCEASEAWIESEAEFLHAAHVARTPVLGICFGAQALAAALGATVTCARTPHIGWELLETH